MKINVERIAYEEFLKSDKTHLRFGQSFFNYFDLHKMKQNDLLNRLYNANDDEAKRLIHQLFEFN